MEILRIIGFIVLCVIMLQVSAFCALNSLYNLGEKSSAGFKNPLKTRVNAGLLNILVLGIWYALIAYYPFK